ARTLALSMMLALLAVGCVDDDNSPDTSPADEGTSAGSASSVETTALSTETTVAGLSLDLYDVSELVEAVSPGVVSVTQSRVRFDVGGGPQDVPAGAGTG